MALEGKVGLFGRSKENPFEDSFPDPLCKLNLKETSEFVKSFPTMTNGGSAHRRREQEGSNSVTNRRLETPSTPGRPVFCFTSVGNLARKSFPSKWDDAEKWLISTSCHDSPAHTTTTTVKVSSSETSKTNRQCDNFKKQQVEDFSEKSRVTEERVSNKAVPSCFQGSVSLDHHNTDMVLKGNKSKTTLNDNTFTLNAFTILNQPFLPHLFHSSSPFLFCLYQKLLTSGFLERFRSLIRLTAYKLIHDLVAEAWKIIWVSNQFSLPWNQNCR